MQMVKDLTIVNDSIEGRGVAWGQGGIMGVTGSKSWLIYIIEMSISIDRSSMHLEMWNLPAVHSREISGLAFNPLY